MVRVAGRYPTRNLAAIREEHAASGAHRTVEQHFPDWVPNDVRLAAERVSEDEAFAELPRCLWPQREE